MFVQSAESENHRQEFLDGFAGVESSLAVSKEVEDMVSAFYATRSAIHPHFDRASGKLSFVFFADREMRIASISAVTLDAYFDGQGDRKGYLAAVKRHADRLQDLAEALCRQGVTNVVNLDAAACP